MKLGVILALVVFTLLGGWLYYAQPQEATKTEQVAIVLPQPPEEIPKPAEGLLLYRRPILGFQIIYPDSLTRRTYSKGNTTTITFQDDAADKGFQVFVVPYAGTTISQERLKMDLPSGVMKDPIQILIDGVTATAFISSDSVLGETREVWFIKDGLLYEVNTRKDLDGWLAEIMTTWKFI
jgi:hypothetical protein